MKKSTLIINADDFGRDSKINRAISDCFKNTLIDSTTIMVNTEGFHEALELADRYNF